MKFKLSHSITVYLVLIFILIYTLSSLESFREHTLGFIVYLVLISIACYFFLSRYSCNLRVDERDVMHINYLAPWQANVNIDLINYHYFDYGRGFYAFVNDRKKGFMNLLRYPYDTIVLSPNPDFTNTNSAVIKVNLRVGQFDKLIAYLTDREKLKLVDSKGVAGFFW